MKSVKTLIMKVDFRLCDFDGESMKYKNPIYIIKYSSPVSLDGLKRQKTTEQKRKLVDITLDNLALSYGYDLKEKKDEIITKILDIMNIIKEK